MSWNPDFGALMPGTSNIDAIETVIVPRARDIGGFEVRRALPTKKKQMVEVTFGAKSTFSTHIESCTPSPRKASQK